MGQQISTLADRFRARAYYHGYRDQTPPCFVSLGMFLKEEVILDNRTNNLYPGGAGLYATFGARLFKTGPKSTEVGWCLAAGFNLPPAVTDMLVSWNVRFHVRESSEELCTKARVFYQDDTLTQKTFKFLTPIVAPDIPDLCSTPLLSAKSFHFLASPAEIKEYVEVLLRLRDIGGIPERPLITWEPAPNTCIPDKLLSHFEIGPATGFRRSQVERHALGFIQAGIGPKQDGLIVVRCGKHGCFYLTSQKEKRWVPAYYNRQYFDEYRKPTVVDPTGAGSAFLGAFTVDFVESKNPQQACLRGAIAASFALEQYGLPKMSTGREAHEIGNIFARKEVWNKSSAAWRLQQLEKRRRGGSFLTE
ncbi:Ribokinase-like protein [Xylariaceae sp. AK1471]|nr:Ribokinase-like protein [Xylariaceae sp. AK1471]